MDRDQILAQIKERIFASQLLSSREKWGMWREIQQKDFDDTKLLQVLHTLEKESQWLVEAEKSAQDQYLRDLQNWNEELDELVREEIPKKMKSLEADDHARDEAEADALLNGLD